MTLMERRRALMGAKESGPSYLTGYEEIGTPSISAEGILTPSGDSWISLPQNFAPGNKPWKIITKVYNAGSTGYQNIFSGAGTLAQKLQNTTKTYLYLRSGPSGSYDITNGTVFVEVDWNSWRYLKLEFTGSQYLWGISSDGEIYTNKTVSTTTPIYGNAKIAFGIKASNTSTVQVQYDLKNTEIWIDGEIWWKAIA